MSGRKSLKRLIRSRMSQTGESYSTARQFFLSKAENIRMQTSVPFNHKETLELSIRNRQVPGAVSLIYQDNQLIESATAGVLSVASSQPVIVESMFRAAPTGSMIATVTMQHVESGRISLDDILVDLLPSVTAADMNSLRKITIRHLLTATHGLDELADFGATGSSDNVIRELLDRPHQVTSLFPPGSNYSYGWLGGTLLAGILEALDDAPFRQVLTTRLFEPLGIDHVWSNRALPDAASGHVLEDEKVTVTDDDVNSSHIAAGATLWMSAAELYKFAAIHLNEGVALTGDRLLRKSSVLEMQRVQFPRAYIHKTRPRHGLSWAMMNWSGHPVLWEDSFLYGQGSRLFLCPDQRLAMIGMVNLSTYDTFDDVWGKSGCFTSLTGVEANKVRRRRIGISKANLPGSYRNSTGTVQIQDNAGELWISDDVFNLAGEYLDLIDPRFARCSVGPVEFGVHETGSAAWIKLAGRVYNRVD